mmetsp:Transcript_21737/g.66976  ORF Transcript_21737/g.66976 Transcript_21737/m.66976 type:complete len:267 (+) Transcript_21737:397-1197(+)
MMKERRKKEARCLRRRRLRRRRGQLVEELGDAGEDGVGVGGGVDEVDLVELLEGVDDGHGGVEVGFEALFDGVDVVVGARGFAALPRLRSAAEDAVLHDLLARFQVQERRDFDVTHVLAPAFVVVEVARKAVDQKVELSTRFHRLLQQLERDFHRNDLALPDELVDQLAVLARRVLALGPQQIARAQVHPAVRLHDPPALRALAAPRATQHEHDPELLVLLLLLGAREAVHLLQHRRQHLRVGGGVSQSDASSASFRRRRRQKASL